MEKVKNMFLLIVTIVVILVGGVSFAFSAQTEEKAPLAKYEYPYGPESRDPMIALINEHGQILLREEEKDRGITSFHLQGIIYSPEGSSQAIINDDIFYEGDSIGGCKIETIDEVRVVLKKGEEEFILKWEGGYEN